MYKALVWLGLLIGSSLGGYVPALFGVNSFSLWGVLGSLVGGGIGIFAGSKTATLLGV